MNDPNDAQTTNLSAKADGLVANKTVNPYQPVLIDDDALAYHDPGFADYRPASFQRTFLRWTLVCSISAAPSFMIGYLMAESRVLGMCAGIAFFIILYTVIDFQTSKKKWRSNKSIRRTLKFTYGTRIAISIIFPLGAAIDMYTGLASAILTQAITGEQFTRLVESPAMAAFLGTLIQGCTMNVILGVYGLIVLVVVKAFEA